MVYVHAPIGLAVAHDLHHHGRGRRGGAHLAHEGGACRRRRLRADRRLVHRGRARHRHALGQAHVGRVLGLGSAPHRRSWCCCSCISATWGCAPASKTRRRRTRRAPCSPSSASSTCPSSSFRWTGGTRCTRPRRSCSWASRRWTGDMLWPLLLMLLAFALYFVTVRADPPARRAVAPRTQCQLGARGAGMSEFLRDGWLRQICLAGVRAGLRRRGAQSGAGAEFAGRRQAGGAGAAWR